jgi:hypothetical protein
MVIKADVLQGEHKIDTHLHDIGALSPLSACRGRTRSGKTIGLIIS